MPVSAEPGLVKRYSTPASFRVWRSSIPPVPVMVLRMVDLAVIDCSLWRTGLASRKPEQYSRPTAPGLVVAGRTRYPVGPLMNFEFSPAEREFAEEVRGFLRAHPPETFPVDGMDAGYGSGAHSRPFLRALADQGWLSLTWPRAFGGQERPVTHKLLLFEELAVAAAPFGPLAGCDQTAEGIIRYGSEHLRREVLPRIARGDATFWQGFSEPDAGSDLLSLKTEAARHGDEYVIRGHKIWSSHAGISSYGLVLARTGPAARRSQGLSMFVVDNGTPGMDIRP